MFCLIKILGDEAESKAIYSMFGDRVPVSSTKGQTGHLLGAAGAVEAAFSLLSIRNQILPFNCNVENICESMAPLNFVTKENKSPEQELEYAMSNSFGFGGINTSLLFKRFKENRF